MLSKTRTIITDVVSLSAKVRGLGQVFEPELFIALDGMLPSDRIVDAIKAFRAAFPTVPMHVRVEASSAVAQLVRTRAVTIGVSAGIGWVDLVPVSAPSDLLAGGGEPLVNKDIERGQLVVLSGHLQRSCVLHAIYRKDTPLGPAASFFLSRLVSQASSEVYRGPAECGVSRLAGKA